MKVTLEIPGDVLDAYQKYADNRGCTLEQALMIPIEDLAPVIDSAADLPKSKGLRVLSACQSTLNLIGAVQKANEAAAGHDRVIGDGSQI